MSTRHAVPGAHRARLEVRGSEEDSACFARYAGSTLWCAGKRITSLGGWAGRVVAAYPPDDPPGGHLALAVTNPLRMNRKRFIPDPTPDPEPLTTHVEIAVGERHVVVESAAPLDVVAEKALQLWREISVNPAGPGDAGANSIGFAAGSGQLAAGELSDGGLLPPEIDFPDHLRQIPEQGTPDDRRDN